MPDAADRQRGSVLMLMPVAVLIFLILGALCVDFGGTYLAQREVSNAAAAAANDAATASLDLERYYATGEVRLLAARARTVAQRSVAAKGLDHLAPEVVAVEVDGAGTSVTVTVRGRASYVFAKALPGGKDHTDVTASSRAEASDLAP